MSKTIMTLWPTWKTNNITVSGIDLRGGGDSGLCHFSIFDSENVSLFEKTAFFHEKRPKYLVLNLKNFRGAFGAAKYPHIPIFLRFIAFLFNKFFEKEKIFLSLSLFAEIFLLLE